MKKGTESCTPEAVRALEMILSRAHAVCICAHAHPDGDAVGSCLGLLHYLRENRGLDARVVLPDEVPGTLSFMVRDDDRAFLTEADKEKERAGEIISGCDLLFVLDCSGPSRTEALESAVRASGAVKVLIDHHVNPEKEGFDLVFSETEISSACELLFNILMSLPDVAGDAGNLPAAAVKALMTGMTTDTNNFANSVFPSTLGMASALLAAGAPRDGILMDLYQSYRENRFRLMGYMLGKMEITPEGAAIMILTRAEAERFGIEEGETEGFVNMPLGIAGVRLSVFLKEEDGKFRFSSRSKPGTSARLLAAGWFHGGGHECAAGGKLLIPEDIPSPDGAESYVRKALKEFLG